jgi:hypothetical protein
MDGFKVVKGGLQFLNLSCDAMLLALSTVPYPLQSPTPLTRGRPSRNPSAAPRSTPYPPQRDSSVFGSMPFKLFQIKYLL